MTNSITPRSLNEQTKVANLDEAKEAIQSIEGQLLELKACIRSIEAVEPLPQYTPERLRALARRFFLMGAEAQQENFECPDIEPYVYIDGHADGLRWTFEDRVSVEGDTYADDIQFNDVVITDDDIDEVIKQESDKTQVGQ
jgi:hypothetical protein